MNNLDVQLKEALELLDGVMYQFGGPAEDGWIDTMGSSDLFFVGEFLVKHERWERRGGGYGRRHFYRRKT